MTLSRQGCTLVLDVSAVQPLDFDYAAASALGVRAVFAKATQGQGSIDPHWGVHVRRAAEAVEMVTSYHVLEAHWADANEQAEEYFETARDASMLFPIVDLERTKNSATVPLDIVAQRAADFVAESTRLWSTVGKRAGLVYCSVDYLAQMCATLAGLSAIQSIRSAGWGLWLAAYRSSEPAPREAAPFASALGWQFTGGGTAIGGVSVDLSWFACSEAQLAAFGEI